MIFLTCETSTLLGSVALFENETLLASQESFRQGSHSDIVHPFINHVLSTSNKKLSDIDCFVTGIGPGSFTGIRISLNTMKAFSYSFNKPILGFNSLINLAAQAAQNLTEDLPIVAMINAYKNMLYVATYRKSNTAAIGLFEVSPPAVIRVQNLAQYIQNRSVVCGDGFKFYQDHFSDDLKQNLIRIETSDEPHAKILGLLARHNLDSPSAWNALTPLYLRASEAEENLKGIKYQPLK